MGGRVLREAIAALLEGGHAHPGLEEAVAGAKPDLRARRPPGNLHSTWELLEHIRIAQENVLRYMLDPGWVSPEWPDGYWPGPEAIPSEEEWRVSLARFRSDLRSLVDFARDLNIDLEARIPHAREHTYIRELLYVADHNAYHAGQIVQGRKLLGDWP